jgi:TolB-like protein/DNA-binding winged helix-turn-helix (wHTH) protein/lipopolysaccharide biosynthesis regulator YciM
MNQAGREIYNFGPYSLDPSEGLLWQGSARIDLPPRALDTLLALVQNNGHLLEKDALLRTVWGDINVEENNISQVIYLLRKALREGEDGTQYIETVPKRGYRFVANVREDIREIETEKNGNGRRDSTSPVPPSSDPSYRGGSNVTGVSARPQADSCSAHSNGGPASSTQARIQPKTASRNSWLRVALIAVTTLSLAALLQGMGWKQKLFGEANDAPIRSLAVLPLQNLSSDPNQEYFVDGMTDELITDLAQIRELKVVSKTSIMQYKGTKVPLTKIGRDLGVDAVVEGSVLRSGDRARITAQLIRTSTDRHIWAKAYDGELKDVLSLQARVAQAITEQVKLNLPAEESGRLRQERNVDPEALELYLRGRYAWNERNLDGFDRAIQYFNLAIEKDPNFALAYSGLADSYTLLALYGEGIRGASEAKVAAEKALKLDGSLAEAHTSLAAVKILHDWDWHGAELEFHRAIELNPNSAQAHHWYGNLLLGPEGRHDEAIKQLSRAQELDPMSLIVRADLGFAYFLAGQDDLAEEEYKKVESANPDFLPVHYYLSQYYRYTGQYDLWLKETVADSTLAGDARTARTLQELYSKNGFHGLMDAMAHLPTSDGVPGDSDFLKGYCSAASANAFLGRNTTALNALQKCYQASPQALIYAKVDPTWANLRAEPKFQAVLQQLHLQ